MSEVSETAANLTASQMLSEARVAMGLSQEEVAQELFLIPNYIRLIDSDQIEKIDKQAFVRGYLRSYAKMVGLDGDDMVARYEQTQGAQPQKIEIRGVTQESVGSTNFTGPVIQTAVMGLVGLVVVVSLVWFLLSSSDDEPVVVTSTSPVVTQTNAEPTSAYEEPGADQIASEPLDQTAEAGVSVSLLEAAEVMSEGVASGQSAVEQVDVSNIIVPAESVLNESNETLAQAQNQLDDSVAQLPQIIDEQDPSLTSRVDSIASSAETAINSEDQAQAALIAVARENGVIEVNAGGEAELRFTFSDECWVEIEDGEGTSIYGDLNRDGDVLLVRGIAPFEVLFGKAPAVTMTYNGEAFDLEPHTTSVETAKVRVGG